MAAFPHVMGEPLTGSLVVHAFSQPLSATR